MFPLISVIVPVYNTEIYIDKCVTSILNQTYSNLEIIIVNDGSTDGSANICDKYSILDRRVKVIHKKNGGLSSARNVGLDVCKGEYVGFVDSDDWISPSMYETLFNSIKTKKTISTIGLQEVTENGNIQRVRACNDTTVSRNTMLENILLGKDDVTVCTRLFPRNVIGDIRFDEQRLNEDLLFMMSIINNIEGVVYNSNIGYFYLKRSGSISRVFGKAVHDMIGNSRNIRCSVSELYPYMSKQAERFEIFQHISFLLCCPSNYNRKADHLCEEVLSYIRKNMVNGLKNPYFTSKDKLKLVGVSFCPRIMSKLVEKKNKTTNERNKQ